MADSSWKDVFRAGLDRIVFALAAFIVATLGIWASGVERSYQVVAALFALAAALLALLWMAEPRAHWFEHGGWRLLATTGTAACSVFVLILGYVNRTERPRVDHAQHAALILMDSSAEMAAVLADGRSRWEAAAETLSQHVNAPATFQTGLATFGGECAADPHIEVGIASGRAAAIRERATTDRAFTGARNLVTAGIWALRSLGEFTGSRQMIIIAGGLDQCDGDLDALAEEASAMQTATRLDLIALGWDEPQQRAFEQSWPDSIGVRFVENSDGLRDAVTDALATGVRLDQLAKQGCGAIAADPDEKDLRGVSLRGAECAEAQLNSADLTGADLSGADLRETNLFNADLTDANLTGADLTDANLGSATLTGITWPGATLNGTNLSSTDLRSIDLAAVTNRTNLNGADLSGRSFAGQSLAGFAMNSADLTGADLSGADLRGTDLFNADLTDANLTGADLTDANLGSATLAGITWPGATLNGTNLSSTDLRSIDLAAVTNRTNLNGADLSGRSFAGQSLAGFAMNSADLTGADLSGADLRETDLFNADLTDANLTGADLTDANLGSATLAGITWPGATLNGTNLSSTDLAGADLTRTHHDDSTRWPDGFVVADGP